MLLVGMCGEGLLLRLDEFARVHSTVDTIENLSDGAHGEKHQVITVTRVCKFGKRQSIHEDLYPAARELKLGEIIATRCLVSHNSNDGRWVADHSST